MGKSCRSRGSRSRSFRAARGPRRSDGVPDDPGPGGVLGVAGMQLVGGDPAWAADARCAGRTDVDPCEPAARRLLMGNLVEGAGQLLNLLPATEVGGGGYVGPRRDRYRCRARLPGRDRVVDLHERIPVSLR